MKVLAAIGLLAIIFAVVAALYFFGGFYRLPPTGRHPQLLSTGRW